MEKKYLLFAKEIAYQAGNIMIKYFNEDNGANYKFDQTIVTKADTEINEYLIKKVKEVFPDHSIDGEEAQFGKSNYVWVCDPVDGTAMYARHIPVAVFSLALVVDGIPIIGVVFDPFTNNLYTASKGNGAYLNNKKISVNNLKIEDIGSIGHVDSMPHPAYYNICEPINEIYHKTYAVSIGSVIRAGMCVANGDFNFALFPGVVHKNCDLAAIKIIVEEAGGKVTDLFGNEQRYDQDVNGAIISNGLVHEDILNIIKKYDIQMF